MFDYSRIDRIDPDFLEQFLLPGEKFEKAFNFPRKKSKKMKFNGQEYNVRYSLEDGLAVLWNEYAYDIEAKWGRIRANYRAMLREAPEDENLYISYEEFIPRNLAQRSPKPVYTKGLQALQEETWCYALDPILKTVPRSTRKITPPADAPMLTHEQVRRRVLCFVAMIARICQEDGLKLLLNQLPLPCTKDQVKHNWSIAHLDLISPGEKTPLTLRVWTENNEIYIFFMHIRNAREIFHEISDTPALFVFPEGEDSGQNPPQLCYAQNETGGKSAKTAVADSWCMTPPQTKLTYAQVNWLGGNQKYVYCSNYAAQAGDLTMIGYPHAKQNPLPGSTFGRMGSVMACSDVLKIKTTNAVDLEYVFTKNPDRKQIAALAKKMTAEVSERTVSEKHSFIYVSGEWPCDTYVHVRYMLRFMTRRLLAAVSVAAHPELASAASLAKAREILRQLPLREGEDAIFRDPYVYEGGCGFDWVAGSLPDEPELARRRAELLKCGAIYAYGSVDLDYDEWIHKRVPEASKINYQKSGEFFNYGAQQYDAYEIFESCFGTAALIPFYASREGTSGAERALVNEYINCCVMMDAVGVMAKCSLVNLLQQYLLAQPPIQGYVSALAAYFRKNAIDWAADLLEAYAREDMEFIRGYAAKDAKPVEIPLDPPQMPSDFKNRFRDPDMNALDRRWLCFDIEMQWREREGLNGGQRLAHAAGPEDLRNALATAMSENEISTVKDRRFALLGFDDDLAAATKALLERQGGVYQPEPDGETDYAVVYVSGFAAAAQTIAQALQAAGGKPALVSDRALWQTLRKFFRPGQAGPAGEEV
ncbi:MAG: hypothetical protein MR620_11700 [Clostridiales bacterium]|nr:hypothetical protein [Clostridiales bacterium]